MILNFFSRVDVYGQCCGLLMWDTVRCVDVWHWLVGADVADCVGIDVDDPVRC